MLQAVTQLTHPVHTIVTGFAESERAEPHTEHLNQEGREL